MSVSQDVREDTLGNQYVNLQDGAGNAINSTSNALNVNISSGSLPIGVADQSSFTYGSTTQQVIGGVYNSSVTALTSGQQGAVSLTAQRAVWSNLRDASGNELGATNAAGVFVKPGDGTNSASFSATGEEFVQIRQGANAATVTASNELKVIDTNAGLISGKMSPSSAAITSVALTASSQSALASNPNRKGFVLVNDSNKIAYVAFGATATTAAYTYKLQPNTVVESQSWVYTGAISVISISGVSGNLVITELS